MIKKIILAIISISLGGVFLFSGYTKLFPIEVFEYQLAEDLHVSFYLAPILARLVIGIEFLLGILLLINFRVRKVSLYTLIFLGLLSVFLVYQIFFIPDATNCGCFGNYIIMTPTQALLKNAVLALLLLALFFLYKGWDSIGKYTPISVFFLGAAAVASPFIMNTLDTAPVKMSNDKLAVKIPIEILYTDTVNTHPSFELQKGKHILVFFSLHCPHCKLAAQKMHVIYKQNPSTPLYMVLNGEPADTTAFFQETKANNVPHQIFNGADNWLKMAGVKLPSIYFLNNGVVEYHPKYKDVSTEFVENWLLEK